MDSRPRFAKSHGDVFIGVVVSQSNPPLMAEFVEVLQCIANSTLDKVAYVVMDGASPSRYFHETREHRIAMARLAASAFKPLIEVAELDKNLSGPSEDIAFKLFGLNAALRFTLVYISSTTDRGHREETVNRLAANIGARLCGFDPNRHRVVALFVGDDPKVRIDVEQRAERYIRGGLFGVEYTLATPLGVSFLTGPQVLLAALRKEGAVECPSLDSEVADYISTHEDYRVRLTEHLSASVERVR